MAGENPHFVTCPCQICNGKIEFDASDFDHNETRTAECPHCHLETVIFIPIELAVEPTTFQVPLSLNESMELFRAIALTKPPAHEDVYTIILNAGVVFYLRPEDFWSTDVEHVICAIKHHTENPTIKPPDYYFGQWTREEAEFYELHKRLPFHKPTLSSAFDNLLENEPWDYKIRVHSAFGRFFIHDCLPSHVYTYFHIILNLGKHFAFSECVTAWVSSAIENKDLAESFNKSTEYLVNIIPRDDDCIYYVFKKTDFVKERLAIILKEEEDQIAAMEAEKLKKSNFSTVSV